jgi:hypothetical protein
MPSLRMSSAIPPFTHVQGQLYVFIPSNHYYSQTGGKTCDLKVRPHYKLKIHCKYRQTPISADSVSTVSVIHGLLHPEK